MQHRGRFLSISVAALWVVVGASACRRSTESPHPSHDDTKAGPVEAPTSELVSRRLQELGKALSPGDPGPVDITLDVEVDRAARPISSLIYGVNYQGRGLGTQRWGLIRCGGNRSTAYNWETNASNAGSDYFFQNDGLVSTSNAPAKPLLDAIDAASAIGAPTIITLSNADYVSADKNGDGDVRKSGPRYLETRFKRNFAKKPSPLAAMPDPTDGAVYQDELVYFLKTQRPKSTLLFSMDNEPDLWSHTHAEIFPTKVTYADLWHRNHAFAKAAKQVWPSAETLGFVSYGYLGFVSLQKAADAGDRNFLEWYLDQARAAEKAEGIRLIDYLDLHWYPEAMGGGERIVSDATSAAVVVAREQAPRSLWDAKYQESSWVRETAGGPIDLLHWVQAKIGAHYPGTKLAFSEWNFGGGKHISGAIATADVLGIFGRYGVGLATYWPIAPDERFAYAAFDVFRNYDRAGAKFGDTSVAATTSDVSNASVYASIDSEQPSRTVIVVINKANVTKRAGIRIRHAAVYGTANVYVLLATQAAVVAAPPLTAVATNAFKYEMPAQSISIVVPQL